MNNDQWEKCRDCGKDKKFVFRLSSGDEALTCKDKCEIFSDKPFPVRDNHGRKSDGEGD